MQMVQQFPFQPETETETEKKLEYLGRLSVCSRKFLADPRMPFAFQPVEPKILAKW